MYKSLRDELTELYAGVTAFTRAPAGGESRSGPKKVHDDIVVYEVMTDEVDRQWWQHYQIHFRGFSSRMKLSFVQCE
jgi:hypothetical protein